MKLQDFQTLTEKKNADTREDQIARAAALGFDTSTVWYHGSTRSFSKFRVGKGGIDELGPGVYLCTSTTSAGSWAGWTNVGGGQMYPCFIRKGPLWNWDKYRSPRHSYHVYDPAGGRVEQPEPLNTKMLRPVIQAWMKYMADQFGPNSGSFRDGMDRLAAKFYPNEESNRWLALAGFIGSIKPSSQVPSQVCVFDPANVRSIFAKFKKPEGRLTDSLGT